MSDPFCCLCNDTWQIWPEIHYFNWISIMSTAAAHYTVAVIKECSHHLLCWRFPLTQSARILGRRVSPVATLHEDLEGGKGGREEGRWSRKIQYTSSFTCFSLLVHLNIRFSCCTDSNHLQSHTSITIIIWMKVTRHQSSPTPKTSDVFTHN